MSNKSRSSSTNAFEDSKFDTLWKGDKVESMSKDLNKYDEGRISDVFEDGTYEVTFIKDGRKEIGVKRDSILKIHETKFPMVLKIHHLVFYGGLKNTHEFKGEKCSYNYLKRFTMPAIWIILATVGLIIHYCNPYGNNRLTTYRTMVITSIYVELVVNYVYAAQYLQINDLRRIVGHLQEQTDRDKTVIYLMYIWGGSLILGILYTMLDSGLYKEKMDPSRLMTDVFISIIGYFNTFYICGIWNWSVWVYYVYYQEAVLSKLKNLGADEDLAKFKESFKRFSDEVNERTHLWKNNHAIRIITGLIIATGYTQMIFYYNTSLEIASPAFFMSCYYGSVWGTIYCAAYVNDSIMQEVMLKLSLIVMKKEPQREDAADLMDTLPVIFTGLNVAGYPMTTGLAFTVGSTVISVILAFTKLGALTTLLENNSE